MTPLKQAWNKRVIRKGDCVHVESKEKETHKVESTASRGCDASRMEGFGQMDF